MQSLCKMITRTNRVEYNHCSNDATKVFQNCEKKNTKKAKVSILAKKKEILIQLMCLMNVTAVNYCGGGVSQQIYNTTHDFR